MRDMILKAVANPPKLFWGAVIPTALNAGLQIPFMFMAMGMGDVNPLIFIIYPLIVNGETSLISLYISFVFFTLSENVFSFTMSKSLGGYTLSTLYCFFISLCFLLI